MQCGECSAFLHVCCCLCGVTSCKQEALLVQHCRSRLDVWRDHPASSTNDHKKAWLHHCGVRSSVSRKTGKGFHLKPYLWKLPTPPLAPAPVAQVLVVDAVQRRSILERPDLQVLPNIVALPPLLFAVRTVTGSSIACCCCSKLPILPAEARSGGAAWSHSMATWKRNIKAGLHC
jgi:hypothetical protein